MTKKQIAEIAGIAAGSFNRLLNNPSWPTLEKIAQALGMEVEEIFSPMIICPHCGKAIKINTEYHKKCESK